MKHAFSCHSSRKFFWSNGTSKNVVLFFQTECSNWELVFYLLKPIFDTSVSGFRSHVLVKGTDLCKW